MEYLPCRPNSLHWKSALSTTTSPATTIDFPKAVLSVANE